MKNKMTLLTVATIATIATVQGVKADETNVPGATRTGIEASGITTSGNGNPGTEKNETAEDIKQPTSKSSNEETGSESNDSDKQGNATEFTKNGGDIQVSNPEVVLDQSKGNGKYQGFTLEYKNINFPDSMEINEGDKVTFELPKEITFQTTYEFDVHNPDNAVVGKATADNKAGTVRTVFNNYFKDHPLNKQMSLKLDAKWTDAVEPGKPVTVNLNGSLVTAQIGEEKGIGKDELISKWGSQDENDPTVINWTIRLNYARKVLNYVKLIDTMSDNQKLVDNYLVMNYVDSVDPWVDKGSALDLIESMAKTDNGFEIKMKRLDRMVYLWYKTKLTGTVKESTNPTNKVELKAEDAGAISSSRAVLVGGRGDAKGENKPDPSFEIPREAPKVEVPEFEGGIPGIPEVREKPEYTEPIWAVPFDAPKYEKPEWQGGVVPNEAPFIEKPELVIEIPDEPTKPKETPKNETPKTEEKPKTEQVKINNQVENHAQSTRKDEPENTVPTYDAPATLPNTGEKLGLPLIGLGVLVATFAVSIKKKGKEDGNN